MRFGLWEIVMIAVIAFIGVYVIDWALGLVGAGQFALSGKK